MVNEEIRMLIKMNESITKLTDSIKKGMESLNVNITDCAKSLRSLAEGQCEKDENYWHPVYGDDGELPGREYDWVLVKIRDDPKIVRWSECQTYDVPHIAEFRLDGKWWPLEWDEPYGSTKVPFEVMYWRPIPD